MIAQCRASRPVGYFYCLSGEHVVLGHHIKLSTHATRPSTHPPARPPVPAHPPAHGPPTCPTTRMFACLWPPACLPRPLHPHPPTPARLPIKSPARDSTCHLEPPPNITTLTAHSRMHPPRPMDGHYVHHSAQGPERKPVARLNSGCHLTPFAFHLCCCSPLPAHAHSSQYLAHTPKPRVGLWHPCPLRTSMEPDDYPQWLLQVEQEEAARKAAKETGALLLRERAHGGTGSRWCAGSGSRGTCN